MNVKTVTGYLGISISMIAVAIVAIRGLMVPSKPNIWKEADNRTTKGDMKGYDTEDEMKNKATSVHGAIPRKIDQKLDPAFVKWRVHNDDYFPEAQEYLSVYNITQDNTDNFLCTPLVMENSPLICVANSKTDYGMMGVVKRNVYGSADIQKCFIDILQVYPRVGVIDVGGPLVGFALIAAQLGHQTVVVSSSKRTLMHLSTSVMRGNLIGSIVALWNAVGNIRKQGHDRDAKRNASMVKNGVGSKKSGHKGIVINKMFENKVANTILFDDILYAVGFEQALLAFHFEDIGNGVEKMTKLLDNVNILYIFCRVSNLNEKNTESFQKMEVILKKENYHLQKCSAIKNADPDFVVWRKSGPSKAGSQEIMSGFPRGMAFK